MEKPPTSYDTLAYPSFVHSQTHPDRLAVLGQLLGMTCAPVDQCRVLELGCGDGGNLVPMAACLPGSMFIGIDLASQPVARAQQWIADLGLTNIQVLQGDIAEIGESLGMFDYIIAHGVFSWIPPSVRESLLTVCKKCLAPQGLAFISYNAYPGWHLSTMVREMMLFHARGVTTPQDRVRQARAMCQFLSHADKKQTVLKEEVERRADYHDGLLIHDDLAGINQPYYFTQFISLASGHGLQYVSDAQFSSMFDHNASPEVKEIMEKHLSGDRILREQYFDFLHVRRFRQTVLCHQEAPLRPSFDAQALRGHWISAATDLSGSITNFTPGVHVSLQKGPEGKMETDYAAGKATLAILIEACHEPIAFSELVQRADELLIAAGVAADDTASEDQVRLCEFLLHLYSAGVIELHAHPTAGLFRVSEKPIAYALSRAQAVRGDTVTTTLHRSIELKDEIGRRLISLLDGTRNRADLAHELRALANAAAAAPESESPPPGLDDPAKFEKDLTDNLKKLAKLGLLVG